MSNTNVQDAVTIISKMSIKTLRCNPRAAAVGEGQPHKKLAIARIYGKASGTKTQEDKVKGEVHTAIVGNFEGVNLETGEVFRSGKLYLPKGVHEMVESAAKKLEAEGEGDSVQFALEIYAVSATNPIGYSYEAKPLVKAAVADDLETLRSQLPEVPKQKALPAGAKK